MLPNHLGSQQYNGGWNPSRTDLLSGFNRAFNHLNYPAKSGYPDSNWDSKFRGLGFCPFELYPRYLILNNDFSCWRRLSAFCKASLIRGGMKQSSPEATIIVVPDLPTKKRISIGSHQKQYLPRLFAWHSPANLKLQDAKTSLIFWRLPILCWYSSVCS